MMAYSEKFAVAVRCNGKVLREVREEGNQTVRLPFGSDYSLRLKNLNSRDAVATISIDGKDVCSGDSIVVKANDTVDLEGFLNDYGVAANAFRFIEKTQKISDYRGDKIDDGLIRVEFQFVEEVPEVVVKHVHHHYDDYHSYWPSPRKSWRDGTGGRGIDSLDDIQIGSSIKSQNFASKASCDTSRSKKLFRNNAPQTDNGITVKGASVNQRFSNVVMPKLEKTKHVIIIGLKGEVEQETVQKVKEPLYVRTKRFCSVCGTMNKSSFKFCTDCGAAF